MSKQQKPSLVNSIQATRVQEAISILNNAIERKTTLSTEAVRLGKDKRFVNNVARQIIANPNNIIPGKVVAEFNQKYSAFARGGAVKKFSRKNTVTTNAKTTPAAPVFKNMAASTVKVEIHNNLPIPTPSRGRYAKTTKYQFEKIKQGQAAVYQIGNKKQEMVIRQAAASYAKRKGLKFITAKIDNTRLGVWHITKAEAKLRRK
jgi:hypothetical protein